MSRYIDAEKFEENLRLRVCKDCNNADGSRCQVCVVDHMLDEINKTPTEDVVAIRRGKWRKMFLQYQCSACGKVVDMRHDYNLYALIDFGEKIYSFCYGCGSRNELERSKR